MSDKEIFKTTDPEGRIIYLYQDTWTHIRGKHPEVKNIQKIKSTIQKPDIITENTERSSLSYTQISRLDLYHNVYAKMDDTYQEGRVSSTFFTGKPPKGDVIWFKKA